MFRFKKSLIAQNEYGIIKMQHHQSLLSIVCFVSVFILSLLEQSAAVDFNSDFAVEDEFLKEVHNAFGTDSMNQNSEPIASSQPVGSDSGKTMIKDPSTITPSQGDREDNESIEMPKLSVPSLNKDIDINTPVTSPSPAAVPAVTEQPVSPSPAAVPAVTEQPVAPSSAAVPAVTEQPVSPSPAAVPAVTEQPVAPSSAAVPAVTKQPVSPPSPAAIPALSTKPKTCRATLGVKKLTSSPQSNTKVLATESKQASQHKNNSIEAKKKKKVIPLSGTASKHIDKPKTQKGVKKSDKLLLTKESGAKPQQKSKIELKSSSFKMPSEEEQSKIIRNVQRNSLELSGAISGNEANNLKIAPRSVYDYKHKILPSNISKVYTEQKQHLYNSEYSKLMFAAVAQGDIGAIQALLGKGADINTTLSSTERSPLMHSVIKNKTDVLRYLIAKGADFNQQDKDHRTALHLAAINRDYKSFKILIAAGADLDINDKDGKKAFYYVKDEYMASTLPMHYNNLNEALLRCAEIGARVCVKTAVQRGANLNACDQNGDTALMLSAKSGNVDVINFLLHKGAKTDLVNKSGDDAIAIAEKNGKQAVADLINTALIKLALNGYEPEPILAKYNDELTQEINTSEKQKTGMISDSPSITKSLSKKRYRGSSAECEELAAASSYGSPCAPKNLAIRRYND